MSTTSAIFTAGGLASGLDTNTIVDKLVALETLPITKNTALQAALTVQISSIGDLASKIKALASSATALGSGVSAYSLNTVPPGISAVAGTGAVPGQYAITVNSVASAARAHSTATLLSASAPATGGDLKLTIQGVPVTIALVAGDISSIARQINQAGKPISAAVVSDGTNFFVTLTNRNTGKPIGSADGGLAIVADPTGLGLTKSKDATNALVTVDDLNVVSMTNDISTAIPGVTITAKAEQLTPSNLVVGSDSTKSTANLQGFVDTYNSIMTALQPSLRPDPSAPPATGTMLDGSTLLELQRKLHGILSSVVAEGTVRTLADLGVKLQGDGTLTLDNLAFTKALTKDPAAVDAIFSTASTGVAAKVSALSTTFTSPVNGHLMQRTTSLKRTIKDITASNLRLQEHVDNYKLQLQRQFANMEKLMANFNSIGNFLTNQESAANRRNK
jgi:flagellar hook-associated protein 2